MEKTPEASNSKESTPVAKPQTTATSTSTTTTTTSNTPVTPKKGLSTGAKVGIGICGGCLGLIILMGIMMTVAGGVFVKYMPDIVKNNLEQNGVDIDTDNGSINITDDETGTEFSAGDDVELPKNFPDDIPVYEPSTVTFKLSQDQNGSVILGTSKSYDTVVSYYTSEMKKEGWTEDTNAEFNDSTILSYNKTDWIASVTISKDDTGDYSTVITITYEYQATE